jgi:hypothetical protein
LGTGRRRKCERGGRQSAANDVATVPHKRLRERFRLLIDGRALRPLSCFHMPARFAARFVEPPENSRGAGRKVTP